ncbi:MAG: sortase [Candidatus Saccharibacteria bacterium]|nr:sortase [Candidatus Saccharibacteria bacterium]
MHEGPTKSTLSEGVWRRPNTANPTVASNTVLAGHVFTYSTPAVFYNLNKVEIGEKLAIYWEGSEYLYKIDEVKTVNASAIEVEAPTENPRLTLYTCTPLWNPVNRLVVTADLL